MEWQSIADFPNYEVSDEGLVRRCSHVMTQRSAQGRVYERVLPAKAMYPFDNGAGYLQVSLTNECGRFKRYVHLLVATAFVEKPKGAVEADHRDEDKTNNRATNLQWITRRENMTKMIESNPHVVRNLVQYRRGEGNSGR